MSDTEPPRILNRKSSANLIRELTENKVLSAQQGTAIEALHRLTLPWKNWIEQVLLIFGAALTLSGIAFFFAYNWNEMTPFQKFALLQCGIVGTAAAGWWFELRSFAGKICVTAACVLTGVFLAVFGQVYQTGADAYELFLGWALLILPWVVFARFSALWILWLILINTGVSLCWDQSDLLPRLGIKEFGEVAVFLGAVNICALAGREIGVRVGLGWLDEIWTRPVLMIAAFGPLTLGTCTTLIEQPRTAAYLVIPALFAISVGIGYWVYRSLIPSMHCLTVIALGVCTVVVTYLARLLLDGARNEFGLFLLLGIIAVAVFGTAAVWLRQIAQTLSSSQEAIE